MGQTWTIADVKFYVFFAVELFSDQDEVQAALAGCPRILASDRRHARASASSRTSPPA